MVTMYPSRYTEVTPVTAETVAQSLVFAGHQGGIAARLAAPRITPAQREHVAELVAAMYASIDDSTKTSLTRWAVFSYLGEHCGNAQHRSLIADASMVLSRNLRGWAVPGADRFRMQQVYIDFRDAIRRGDGDAAERLAREMYYV
jgi:DNA-binding GntR family transcriptional regulator